MFGDIPFESGRERPRRAEDIQRELNDHYADLPTDGEHWRRGGWILIATAIGTLALVLTFA